MIPDERPIVLLHGWGVSSAVWAPLAATLGQKLICPSITQGATDLAGRLPDEALVVGWSLGGMQALDLAWFHPEKCAGLVLIATTPRFVAGDDWRHGLSPEVVIGFKESFSHDPRRTLKRFVALQALHDTNRTGVATMLDAVMANPEDQFEALATGLETLCTLDLRTRLPAGLPCTLIHGRGDAVVPAGAAAWLAAQLPGSVLHLFEDTGHAPHLSDAEATASIILEAYADL